METTPSERYQPITDPVSSPAPVLDPPVEKEAATPVTQLDSYAPENPSSSDSVQPASDDDEIQFVVEIKYTDPKRDKKRQRIRKSKATDTSEERVLVESGEGSADTSAEIKQEKEDSSEESEQELLPIKEEPVEEPEAPSTPPELAERAPTPEQVIGDLLEQVCEPRTQQVRKNASDRCKYFM